MTYSMMRFAAYDQVKGLMHKGESPPPVIAINTRYAAESMLACSRLSCRTQPHALT